MVEALKGDGIHAIRGICNDLHAALIKSGLRNRTALHKIAQYVDENEITYHSAGGLRRRMQRQKENVMEYIESCDIPQLEVEKIVNWIG